MKRIKKVINATEGWDKKPVIFFPDDDILEIEHGEDTVIMDRKQAKDLLEILKEVLGE